MEVLECSGHGGAASLDPPVTPVWDQTPPSFRQGDLERADLAPQTSWRTRLRKHTRILTASLFICF